jgi:MSHA pilin protein MshC
MSGMSVFRQRGEYDAVVSAIQFARKSAIAKRRYVCVSLSATAVSLTVDSNPPEATATPFGGACPFATPLPLPTPDSACAATNQSCLQATSISSPPPAFQFDALGRAAATVTVTVTGFPAITVEAETGHVR